MLSAWGSGNFTPDDSGLFFSFLFTFYTRTVCHLFQFFMDEKKNYFIAYVCYGNEEKKSMCYQNLKEAVKEWA